MDISSFLGLLCYEIPLLEPCGAFGPCVVTRPALGNKMNVFVMFFVFFAVVQFPSLTKASPHNRAMNFSDNVISLVSDCPANLEGDNVLFCFYLPTQQWEKVRL